MIAHYLNNLTHVLALEKVSEQSGVVTFAKCAPTIGKSDRCPGGFWLRCPSMHDGVGLDVSGAVVRCGFSVSPARLGKSIDLVLRLGMSEILRWRCSCCLLYTSPSPRDA